MALKLQQGGSFDPFFTIYQSLRMEPPRRESRSSSRESSSKKEKEKLEEDPILKMVIELFGKIKGLPNEMRDVIAGFTSSLRLAKEFGNGNVEDLTALYLLNLLKLKIAEYNMKSFDDVYKEAQRLGNLSDVALIGNSVVVLDSNGKITTVSMSKWLEVKDSGEYKPLTNGNIMWYRSNVPSYAFDGDLLLVVLENIGTDQVVKMIQERALNLGSVEEIVDQYGVKQGNTITKGLELIQQGIKDGPDGVYKLTTTNENSATLIEAALKYIYSSLNDLARARLNFLAVNSNGTTKDIGDLILNLLSSKASAKSKISFGFDSSASKAAGFTTDKETELKDNYGTKVIKGLGTPTKFGISVGDENLVMVDGRMWPILGKNDDKIGINKPITDLGQSSLSASLMWNQASIGGIPVALANLNHVIADGDKLYVIDYPVEIDPQGRIIPRLSPDIQERKKKADELLRSMQIDVTDPESKKKNYQTINLIYVLNGLTAPYGPLGDINSSSWARFVVVPVATDGKVVGTKDTSRLELVTDKYERDNIISAIKESDKNYDFSTGLFGSDSIYKGTLWLPMIEGYNASTAGDRISTAATLARDIQDLNLHNRSNITSSDFE